MKVMKALGFCEDSWQSNWRQHDC